jgi:hypothetical protein
MVDLGRTDGKVTEDDGDDGSAGALVPMAY